MESSQCVEKFTTCRNYCTGLVGLAASSDFYSFLNIPTRHRPPHNLTYLLIVSRHFLEFQIVVLASGVGPDVIDSVPEAWEYLCR